MVFSDQHGNPLCHKPWIKIVLAVEGIRGDSVSKKWSPGRKPESLAC
jgi:hypothetical protein